MKLFETKNIINSQVYQLWCLAGGRPDAEMRRGGLVKHRAAVHTLPHAVSLEGELMGGASGSDVRHTDTLVLSVSQLLTHLTRVNYDLLLR